MQELSRTFAALSDPVRLRMVDHLLRAGESPAGDLVALTEISAPAVSGHLKVLRESGVLVQRAAGTHRYYRVNPAAMGALDDWMARHRAFWSAGLDRLGDYLDSEGDVDATG